MSDFWKGLNPTDKVGAIALLIFLVWMVGDLFSWIAQ
jgi:hypothetical protein